MVEKPFSVRRDGGLVITASKDLPYAARYRPDLRLMFVRAPKPVLVRRHGATLGAAASFGQDGFLFGFDILAEQDVVAIYHFR